jgi:Spy/CpxP family protein refolding chaperone
MKNSHKKLVGVLLGGLLIATIGAALATGQTDDTTDETIEEWTDDMFPQASFGDQHDMMGLGPLGTELTDEQQTQIEELMTNLREQNATPDEMRTAIQEKLDEFGVLDTRLDNKIAQTEQRLIILNRQKELRNEGYTWADINSLIEEEFGENATGIGWNVMGGHGCGRGPHGGQQDNMIPEESDQ